MNIIHNSQQNFYRNPFGAVECESYISLKILIKGDEIPLNVFLRQWVFEKETFILMKKASKSNEGTVFQAKIKIPKTPCLFWYYFIIETNEGKIFYCNDSFMGGEGKASLSPTHSYQITVYEKGFKTPDFYKNAIMYQIFPDRFFNGNENNKVLLKNKDYYIHKNWSEIPINHNRDEYNLSYANDFFGGNLLGIIKKLPYLKDLGINIIYLNPIFEAYSNHKYDTGDYEKIDPMFGDEEIFKDLTKKANELGIKIILDGVFSHTGSDSKYFNKKQTYKTIGAYNSNESPYYNWYSFKKHPDDYDCWWGIRTLPNVNELCPSYIDYILTNKNSVVKKWIRNGAAGFRLDVADELPDEFLKILRTEIKKENENAIIIGEVWEDASHKESYGKIKEYFLGNELDSVMNYPFKNCVINFIRGTIDGYFLNKTIMSLYENYPKDCFYSLMNILSTHDVPRLRLMLSDSPMPFNIPDIEKENYRLSDEKLILSFKRLMVAVIFQMTFPGIPTIYYGDEAGLYSYEDPFNRGTYPWRNEDLKVLNFYKSIISIRNENSALQAGEFSPVFISDDVYAYIRFNNNNLFLIALNRNLNESKKIVVNLSNFNLKCLTCVNTNKRIKPKNGNFEININEISGNIFKGKIN